MTWTTRDEVGFIQGLGTGSYIDPRTQPLEPELGYRLRILEKYRASIPQRAVWAGLNRREIEIATDHQISVVKQLLMKEEKK